VQNVSQAVRAFCISGNKAQFNGVSPRGEKKYRSVSTAQHETTQKIRSLPKATPGSYITFPINPSITALASLNTVPGFTVQNDNAHFANETLNTEGVLDILSADFSRALKDLAVVLNDLKRLSALGDLPLTYHSNPAALRVHFPGCDADTVEVLCSELDIQRGIVVQDAEFDAFVGTDIALLFPFAPTRPASELYKELSIPAHRDEIKWRQILSPAMRSEEEDSILSQDDDDDDLELYENGNPWMSEEDDVLFSPEGYDSMRTSEVDPCDPLEYQDFEGMYRFMEMCDHERR